VSRGRLTSLIDSKHNPGLLSSYGSSRNLDGKPIIAWIAVHWTLPRAGGSVPSNASLYKYGRVSEVLCLASGGTPLQNGHPVHTSNRFIGLELVHRESPGVQLSKPPALGASLHSLSHSGWSLM
jgi:hypothetical protein